MKEIKLIVKTVQNRKCESKSTSIDSSCVIFLIIKYIKVKSITVCRTSQRFPLCIMIYTAY